MQNPKISIITATYNNRQTLEETFHSLHNQTYPNIEHIVIDGASTDGTLELIDRFRTHIHLLISEKDNGVYEALNKGLKHATGDIIGFLHADDSFYSASTIEQVAKTFSNNDVVAVYGDLLYVDRHNPQKIIRYWQSQPFTPRLLRKGWMPAHPTLFFKSSIINEIGLFDIRYHIAADYEYMIRMLLRYPPEAFHYIPSIITCMKVGGKSNRSLSNIIRKMKEDYHIIKKHRIGGITTLLGKNFLKLNQFFKPIAKLNVK
ncbi:MAG: glycosyltransferase family 2 protein [Bacteroidales bacterium]